MFFDCIHVYEMLLSTDIDLNWGQPLASLVWLQFWNGMYSKDKGNLIVRTLHTQSDESFILFALVADNFIYLTFHTMTVLYSLAEVNAM